MDWLANGGRVSCRMVKLYGSQIKQPIVQSLSLGCMKTKIYFSKQCMKPAQPGWLNMEKKRKCCNKHRASIILRLHGIHIYEYMQLDKRSYHIKGKILSSAFFQKKLSSEALFMLPLAVLTPVQGRTQ